MENLKTKVYNYINEAKFRNRLIDVKKIVDRFAVEYARKSQGDYYLAFDFAKSQIKNWLGLI